MKRNSENYPSAHRALSAFASALRLPLQQRFAEAVITPALTCVLCAVLQALYDIPEKEIS